MGERLVALLYWPNRIGTQRKIQIAKSAGKSIWVGLDNRWHSDLKQICRHPKTHLKYRDTTACETVANDR